MLKHVIGGQPFNVKEDLLHAASFPSEHATMNHHVFTATGKKLELGDLQEAPTGVRTPAGATLKWHVPVPDLYFLSQRNTSACVFRYVVLE